MSDLAATRGRPRDVDRRVRVLRAATDHVLRVGLQGATLRGLADALDTSPRMLLYDFGSTSDLLVAISNQARQEMAAMVEEQLRRDPNPARAVEQAWRWLTAAEHAGYARFVVDLRRALLTGQLPADRVAETLQVTFSALDAPPADHTLVMTVFAGLLELHLHGQSGEADAAMARFLTVLRTR